MSTLTINYNQLEATAKRSADIAKAANEYADSLEKTMSKLGQLTGGASDYTSNANYYVSKKVGELRSKSNSYSSYSKKCSQLSQTAKRIDENVAQSIASNHRTFLSKHENLKISELKATLISWLVDLKNKCPLVELLSSIHDMLETELAGLVDSIRYWYNCEGGKQVVDFIKAIGGAIIALLLFIASFPASGFFAIIAAIGAGIALLNAVTNIYTSYKAMKEDDPAWAKIYGDQNKLSDVLRESNFNNGFLNKVTNWSASALDAAELFCDVVNIAHTIGTIASKFGFIKNFFSKDIGLLSYMKEARWGTDGKMMVGDNGLVKTRFTARSIWSGIKAYVMNSPIDTHSEQGIRTILHNNFVADFKDFKGTLTIQAIKDTFRYNVTKGNAITMQDWKNSMKPGTIADTVRYNFKYNSFRGLMENGEKWNNAKTYIKNIGSTGKSVMNFAERIERVSFGSSNFSSELKSYVDTKIQKSTNTSSLIHDVSDFKKDFSSLIQKHSNSMNMSSLYGAW